jgi:hypothetical protein
MNEYEGNRGEASRRLSELRGGPKPNPLEPISEPVLPEAEEVAGDSFSTLSADRIHKVALELRFLTGDATAFPYSYLVRSDLMRSEGIILDFAGTEVRITGRNLRPLFSGLVAQRVAFVEEQDELYAEANGQPNSTVVTAITVTKPE